MLKDFLITFTDFFTKQISYNEFQSQIDSYLKAANPAEITLFYNETTDNGFFEFDPDMIMLAYIYIWLFPNRLNQQEIISGADNMYLSFLKSVLDAYQEDFKKEVETITSNFNYQIYKRGNVIIILNTSDFDISVKVPDIIKDGVHYCINCGDDVEIEDTLDIYPYGFYIIEI